MMQYKQAEFRRIKDNAWTLGWVKSDCKCCEGEIVSLKDSRGKWKIVKMYSKEYSVDDIKHDYHVGEL